MNFARTEKCEVNNGQLPSGLRREMNARFDDRFDKMDARFDQMYDRMLVQTRWLIGSLTLIGTIISILLAIGQFVQ